MTSTSNSNPQQIAEGLGRKLGFFIAALNIAAPVREALLNLLPSMTPEQLTELILILETHYLHSATEPLDKELADALGRLDANYQQNVAAAEKETRAELNNLGQQLSAKAK